MRMCSRCRAEKPANKFPKHGRYCLACHSEYNREWRLKNAEKHRKSQAFYATKVRRRPDVVARQKKYQRKAYLKNPAAYKARALRWKIKTATFIYRVKRMFGCSSCGEGDPVCLSFHHIRDKKYAIADMVRSGHGIKAVKDEIRKCIVLCMNCHAKEHSSKRIAVKNISQK